MEIIFLYQFFKLGETRKGKRGERGKVFPDILEKL
jgi:hypothetical protein